MELAVLAGKSITGGAYCRFLPDNINITTERILMMANFIATINEMKELESRAERSQMLAMLLMTMKNKKVKWTEEEKRALSEFALLEAEDLILRIPATQTYKEKDVLFEYEDRLLGAIMACNPSAADVPEEMLSRVDFLNQIVQKERFLENMVDEIFNDGKNDPENVRYLISMMGLAREEYHKGKLYEGLIHYEREVRNLPDESRDLLGAHLESELNRYLAGPLTEPVLMNLELICDLCRLFPTPTVSESLQKALLPEHAAVCFYAMSTLLFFGKVKEIPNDTVVELAKDLAYANMTYDLLSRYGLEGCFPSVLSTPEYLAQSDLIYWLLYPTELGQKPDEIEYLGKVKKGETFYIFRFRSNSKNLDEASKNKWLIGWSGSDGSTFSNFDLYESYEQKTPEKTLKYIKKKLL